MKDYVRYKQCNCCRASLPFSEFRKTAKGYAYRCKECDKRYYESQHLRFEEIRNKLDSLKICSCCGYEMPKEFFRKTEKGYARRCLRCDERTPEQSRKESEARIKRWKAEQELIRMERTAKMLREMEESRIRHQEFLKAKEEYDKKHKEDMYLTNLLVQSGVPKEAITDELIDFKRAHLQLKRELKRQETALAK